VVKIDGRGGNESATQSRRERNEKPRSLSDFDS
jgi:hypothetical protein